MTFQWSVVGLLVGFVVEGYGRCLQFQLLVRLMLAYTPEMKIPGQTVKCQHICLGAIDPKNNRTVSDFSICIRHLTPITTGIVELFRHRVQTVDSGKLLQSERGELISQERVRIGNVIGANRSEDCSLIRVVAVYSRQFHKVSVGICGICVFLDKVEVQYWPVHVQGSGLGSRKWNVDVLLL